MASAPAAEGTGSLRARIVEAGAELTSLAGWASVTMGKLAVRVGVSRQTVYNEIGSKPALAEAMVLRELERFLARVDAAFEQHPDDLVDAIRAAAYDVLTMARANPLLHAVVSASHGAGSDLLPLLTTQSEALIETSRLVIHDHLVRFELPMQAREIDASIDTVVRVVLSHIMAPVGAAKDTADDIAWIARRVLGQ